VPSGPFGSKQLDVGNDVFLGIDWGKVPVPPRLYMQSEYLLWWMNDFRIPPLATTGTGTSTGFLGQPGTVVLFGPGDDHFGARSGARFTDGLWLDDSRCIALEESYLFLGKNGFRFTASSNQFGRIARPFFSPNVNSEVAEDVVAPGVATGGIAISGSSVLFGYESNIRWNICSCCGTRIDMFAGFRYLELSESLDIAEALVAGPLATDPVGTRTFVEDRFATRNQFYGGQLGTYLEHSIDRWFIRLRAAVALGQTDETITINGGQTQIRPGSAATFVPGGLLAVSSNSGHFGHEEFAVVPELNLNVGYQVARHCRIFGGVGFLYWSRVARPGDQIDRVVDVTLVPNPPAGVQPSGTIRPVVPFRQTDVWAYGFNLGAELQW
jgi:hypothetical protein